MESFLVYSHYVYRIPPAGALETSTMDFVNAKRNSIEYQDEILVNSNEETFF